MNITASNQAKWLLHVCLQGREGYLNIMATLRQVVKLYVAVGKWTHLTGRRGAVQVLKMRATK